MDDSARVHPAQCRSKGDRDAQKRGFSQRAPEKLVEDRSSGILEHQCQAVAVTRKLDWVSGPGGVKIASECVFMLKPCEAGGRAALSRGEQDRRQSITATSI